MCYHTKIPDGTAIKYHIATSIVQEYGLRLTTDIPEDYPGYFHANGFTAPQIPVICNDNPNKIILSEWGYLPGKIKDEKEIKAFRYKYKTLNAKADTFITSKMFKSAFEKRRCLILINGFYEYRHETSKLKVPYYIYPKEKCMWLFGGVYNDTVDTSTGNVFRSVAIATTPANEMMGYIHNSRRRMPFIMNKERLPFWLKKEELQDKEIASMVRPYPDRGMVAYTISKDLNYQKINTNVPEITLPVAYKGIKNFI